MTGRVLGSDAPSSMRDSVEMCVLTPTRNYCRYLGDALDSVENQAGIDLAHLVQDCASTDGTVELLQSRNGAVDWRSEPDRGQSDGLNRALARASGRWISWLNADEFYMPDALRRLAAVGTSTGADVVYGDSMLVDEAGRLIRLVPQHPFRRRMFRSYGRLVASDSCIVRRATLRDTGWNTGYRKLMDWELFLRLMSDGAKFLYVPIPVGAFRMHDARVTAQPSSAFSEEYRLLEELYGAGRWSSLGAAWHAGEKVASGAYRRQLRGRLFHGEPLRWFSSSGSARVTCDLLSSVYALECTLGSK